MIAWSGWPSMPCCFTAWLWIVPWNHRIKPRGEQTADGKFSWLHNQTTSSSERAQHFCGWVAHLLRLPTLDHERNSYLPLSSLSCPAHLLKSKDRIICIFPFAFLLISKWVRQPSQSGYCPRLGCLCYTDSRTQGPPLPLALWCIAWDFHLRDFN